MSDFKKAAETPPDVEKAPSVTSQTEAGRGYETPGAADNTLKRQLKDRHVAMISIGGASIHIPPRSIRAVAKSPLGVIGTGLFLGTASSLRNGGPVGLLLGYTVKTPPPISLRRLARTDCFIFVF